MTCAERIRRIRLIKKLEANSETKKEADGTLKYTNENGEVLIEARTRAR